MWNDSKEKEITQRITNILFLKLIFLPVFSEKMIGNAANNRISIFHLPFY